MALMVLLQFLTGYIMLLGYVSGGVETFLFVIELRRMNFEGWFFQAFHFVGAGLIFGGIFMHLYRGLVCGSGTFPNFILWLLGFILYFLMMAEAFTGYVLPWSQMGYWAAVVIFNIVATFPLLGESFLCWIYGGFMLGTITVSRIFMFHMIISIFIGIFMFLHIDVLHDLGSSDIIGSSNVFEDSTFSSFSFVLDFFYILLVIELLILGIGYDVWLQGTTAQFVEVNYIETPSHIIPEWYFLPYYAVLKSIDHKIMGVFLFFMSIWQFLLIPFFTLYDIYEDNLELNFIKGFWKGCYSMRYRYLSGHLYELLKGEYNIVELEYLQSYIWNYVSSSIFSVLFIILNFNWVSFFMLLFLLGEEIIDDIFIFYSLVLIFLYFVDLWYMDLSNFLIEV